MKISLWVVIHNENLVRLSYFQGINGVFVVVGKKNLVCHIMFIDFLNLMG